MKRYLPVSMRPHLCRKYPLGQTVDGPIIPASVSPVDDLLPKPAKSKGKKTKAKTDPLHIPQPDMKEETISILRSRNG